MFKAIKYKLILSIFMLLSFSQNAFAAYTCSGNVKGTTVHPNGTIYVEGIGGGLRWVVLCSLKTDYGTISPEACKGVHATLLTAQTTNKQVVFWFNDELTCTTHPAWRQLTGWYFGPKLAN